MYIEKEFTLEHEQACSQATEIFQALIFRYEALDFLTCWLGFNGGLERN
jgi:hypothetical protein